MATGKEIVERIRRKQRKPKPVKPLDFSKLTTKGKQTVSQIRNLVGTGRTKVHQAISPVTSKIKPTLSNVKSQLGTALNTKQGIKLRVAASRLNNLVIDKSRPRGGVWGTKGYLDLGKITKGKGWLPIAYKGGKGFIRKTPIIGHGLNAILGHADFKNQRQELIDKGYKPSNASRIAFIRVASEHGGYSLGALGGGALLGTGGSVIPGAGTAGGIFAGSVGGGFIGGALGEHVLSPLLIRATGGLRSKAELQNQLNLRRQRTANIARTNQLKDEAGDQ